MAIQNILSAKQFDKFLDQTAGRRLLHTPVTKNTSNVTGQETLTEGTSAFIKAHFVRTSQRYEFEKAGLIEQGNAILISKYSDNVQKDDLITANNEKFRVLERYDVAGVFDGTGTETEYVYTVSSLFLYE
jgi:hypothetical protein